MVFFSVLSVFCIAQQVLLFPILSRILHPSLGHPRTPPSLTRPHFRALTSSDGRVSLLQGEIRVIYMSPPRRAHLFACALHPFTPLDYFHNTRVVHLFSNPHLTIEIYFLSLPFLLDPMYFNLFYI